jgi:hypothetical protein
MQTNFLDPWRLAEIDCALRRRPKDPLSGHPKLVKRGRGSTPRDGCYQPASMRSATARGTSSTPRPMDLGDHATQFWFLVRDRPGQFAASFDALLADASIEVVKIPPPVSAGELLRRTLRVDRPDRGHRPDLIFGERHLGRYLPYTPPIQRPAAASGAAVCGRRAQHCRILSRLPAGSGVDRSWASSSTRARPRPEIAGQARWPCSGTPQAITPRWYRRWHVPTERIMGSCGEADRKRVAVVNRLIGGNHP